MAWNKHQLQQPAAATESTPLILTDMPSTLSEVTSKATKDRLLELSGEESVVITTFPSYHSLSEDIIETVKLGVPIFIAMLSWVGVRVQRKKSTVTTEFL